MSAIVRQAIRLSELVTPRESGALVFPTECLGVGPPGKSEAARLVHFPLAASWSFGELVGLHSRE